jgi:predicted AlkP superfamily phosphohydrolase/phosphomutase
MFEDGASPGLKSLASEAKAFALDPGRIYVHSKERYPDGSIEANARRAVVDDLMALFESLQIEGEKVIQHAYRGKELYSGSQMHRAPDLVLLGESGYNLRGNWKAKQPFGKGIFTGKHSQADAFLLVYGEEARAAVPEEPSVMDIVGIMNQLG